MRVFRVDRFVPTTETWYHGTTSLNLPSIKSKGLLPTKSGQGAFVWAQKQGMKIPAPAPRVYITQNLKHATTYAQYNAQVHGGDPIVLSIAMPNNFMGEVDPDDAEHEDCRYPKLIPASRIKDVTPVHKHTFEFDRFFGTMRTDDHDD